MRIVVLMSDVPGLQEDTSVEAESGKDAFITAAAVEAGLTARGHTVARAVIRKSLLDALERYDPREWLVFNLCETLEGESYREPYVPAVLDVMGYTYTGSTTATLHRALNKARTKRYLAGHGLPTAAYQVFESPDQPIEVPFPAFVKPVAEDGSIGVNERAVARTTDELREQVRYILREMGEPALVEEFIEGREFNVAIWGNQPPEVLPLAEIDFRHIGDPFKQIISFAAKWDHDAFEYHHTDAICPAVVEDALAQNIRRVAADAYRLMGCRDYARVDLRVRGQQPYILEVNPNCGIAPDAGFVRQARVGGYDYAAMVEQIAAFAHERHP
ncbi:MAG: ATP-grasp domain-containing protein [Chloroflexi bacterium]|nr:ATP-grasp domain-containing protein [Chloroflexota bacterium]